MKNTMYKICFGAFFVISAFMAGVLAAGCAPTLQAPVVSGEAAEAETLKQKELAFETYVKRDERLINVAWPLLTGGAELCGGDVWTFYGFVVHDLSFYGGDFRSIAAKYYSIGDGVYVMYAHEKLPAYKAGLRKGDKIIAVNGQTVDKLLMRYPGREEGRKNSPSSAVLEAVAGSSEKGLSLTIDRSGKRIDMLFKGVTACKYNVRLQTDDTVNAYADGQNVVITTGMLRFTENEGELAVVVGHEIAHNALSHIDKKKGNAALGTIVDLLILGATGVNTGGAFGNVGATAYSQEFESEADYAGLYITARGGYEVKDAPYFWRRMAVEHPGSIKKSYSGSHPSTPERYVALEAAAKEIEAKKLKNLPLLPDAKKKK